MEAEAEADEAEAEADEVQVEADMAEAAFRSIASASLPMVPSFDRRRFLAAAMLALQSSKMRSRSSATTPRIDADKTALSGVRRKRRRQMTAKTNGERKSSTSKTRT